MTNALNCFYVLVLQILLIFGANWENSSLVSDKALSQFLYLFFFICIVRKPCFTQIHCGEWQQCANSSVCVFALALLGFFIASSAKGVVTYIPIISAQSLKIVNCYRYIPVLLDSVFKALQKWHFKLMICFINCQLFAINHIQPVEI